MGRKSISPDTGEISNYIKEIRTEFEEKLKRLVEIPTVSADPKYSQEIRQAAVIAQDYLRSSGATAEICETSGNPVIIGRFNIPGATRSLTIYNHLDVQPADEPEWKQSPFVFQKRGDRYCGRGTTDDKGPALTALFAARYSYEKRIPLNIQFIWEMEEESGSAHFEEFLKKHAQRLRSDAVMVVDSIWISRDTPSICYGIRGNVTGSMILETAKAGVHSGLTGGVARNPLIELCTVVSRCVDAGTGKVLIPGFYNDVQSVSKQEMRNFLSSGFNFARWKQDYGFKSVRRCSQAEALKRLWTLPTFEVHGMVGGYTGPKVKTSIPPRAELKFSCRLVPDQNPDEICALIKKFVKRINPDVRIIFHAKLHWYVQRISGLHADAIAAAMKFGFGRTPAFVRSGGSDGAIILLNRYLNAPVLMPGLSLPEHGYHAPNEYYEWRQVSGGIKSFIHYFYSLAA